MREALFVMSQESDPAAMAVKINPKELSFCFSSPIIFRCHSFEAGARFHNSDNKYTYHSKSSGFASVPFESSRRGPEMRSGIEESRELQVSPPLVNLLLASDGS